jgi:hypothetical protein
VIQLIFKGWSDLLPRIWIRKACYIDYIRVINDVSYLVNKQIRIGKSNYKKVWLSLICKGS